MQSVSVGVMGSLWGGVSSVLPKITYWALHVSSVFANGKTPTQATEQNKTTPPKPKANSQHPTPTKQPQNLNAPPQQKHQLKQNNFKLLKLQTESSC